MGRTKVLLIVVLIGCFVGCSDKRTHREVAPGRMVVGAVIWKKHFDKTYMNPVDNINLMKDIDPFFDLKRGRLATTSPERNLIRIRLEASNGGEVEVDNKLLFERVELGSKVRLELAEVYTVTTDKQGNVLSKSFFGYKIFSVNPL